MAEKKYRTIHGFVKFPPRENEVERDGETITVRSVLIRNAGVLNQAIDVRATVWPSHDHIEINEGDLLTLEGKFEPRKGEDKDGNPVTFFNLSVSKIVHHGAGDEGIRDDEDRPAKKSKPAADADEDGEAW